MAVYLALAVLRDQRAMAASLRDRRLGEPLGYTLLQKTALLVGFGNIAAELVPRLKPFGMRMIAVRRSQWDEPPVGPAQLLDQRAQWPQLQRCLPEADIIVRLLS
jgi:phosphoglycerate dehydrogenase-like enzyme